MCLKQDLQDFKIYKIKNVSIRIYKIQRIFRIRTTITKVL